MEASPLAGGSGTCFSRSLAAWLISPELVAEPLQFRVAREQAPVVSPASSRGAGGRTAAENPRSEKARSWEPGVVLDTLEHVATFPPQPVRRVLGRSEAQGCLEALSPSELPLSAPASRSHGRLKPLRFRGSISEFSSP